jgi:hypothetical protein
VSDAIEACELWWAWIRAQLDRKRRMLPAELRGRIQFLALSDDLRLHRFHVVLDGQRSTALPGEVADPDAVVSIRNGELERLLAGLDHETLFEVSGEAETFFTLLDAIELDRPKNLIDIRGL